MNDAVIPEIQLLVFSILAGILCFFGYDLLLVSRVFFRRPLLIEKIGDILYWCAASVLVFSMIHQKNSGVIRGYSVAGMLAGMILYRAIAKERLVSGARRLVEKIEKWGKEKLEPFRKKKLELKNKRKQAKIEKKKKRQAVRAARQIKRAEGQENAPRTKKPKKSRQEKRHKKGRLRN